MTILIAGLAIVGALGLSFGIGAFFAFMVENAWNLLAPVFGLPALNLWQAGALVFFAVLVGRILRPARGSE